MSDATELFDTQPIKIIAAPDHGPFVEPHDRPALNWLKWSVGCGGLLMLLISGLIMAGLIVLPVAFRSLPAESRSRIVEKLPLLGTLQPTRIYRPTTLPTAQNTIDARAVAELLNTATPTIAPTNIPDFQPTSLLATITSTPLLAQLPSDSTLNPTNTPQPSPTSLPTQLPSVVPTSTPKPLPVRYHLDSIKRVFQQWNDCGPANLTQVLKYYGWSGNEDDARNTIKPQRDDRNVSPWELVDFVRTRTGVKAIARVGGDLNLIKALVSANFGVIIETGYNLPDGWAGHYLTVLGYDDNQQILYGGDTNLGFGTDGLGIQENYAELDGRWQAFNRLFIVVFPREREAVLASILGRNADPNENINYAFEIAQREINQNKDNPFAWFNLGSLYTQLGDYKRASVAFYQSINTGTQLPWRFLWYQFTPFEAYYKTGNFQEVKALANSTLANAPIEEARYWRGMAAAATGDKTTAMDDFKWVIRFNPNFTQAADALAKVQNGTFQLPDSAKVNTP